MKARKDRLPTTMPFGGYGITHGPGRSGNSRQTPAVRPPSSSNTASALPNIPTLRLPGMRMRPGSGLTLAISAIPNAGLVHPPTVARERPPQASGSDAKSPDYFRPPSLLTRRGTPGERSAHRNAVLPVREQPARPPSSLPRTLPPIATPEREVRELGSGELEPLDEGRGDSESEDSSTEESDEEFFSDDASDAPPSRPGFESESEKSAQAFAIPFPDVANLSSPFPATIIQDHAHLDQEKYAANVTASGLSPRVDNIVRAFHVHGPLNRELLSKALNQVVKLHPLLTASFQRSSDRLYELVSPGGEVKVNIETPIIGHESPEDMIITARRKLFPLLMRTDLCPPHSETTSGYNTSSLSVVSFCSKDSPQGTPPMERFGAARNQELRAKKKSVSFAGPQILENPMGEITDPLPPLLSSPKESDPKLLMRVKLVVKTPHEHILVLSFPRIICDYWSSCLFVQQLADAYATLERSTNYRPSLAAMRIEGKRQTALKMYGRMRGGGVEVRGGGVEGGNRGQRDAASRHLLKRVQGGSADYCPPVLAKIHFQQLAQRENQLLKMVPKERLWTFWVSMVTATIKRQRGPNRTKVIPPVRIPSGLGEKTTVGVARAGRPQTSRLRPLTARNRPQTGRRQSGVFGDTGMSREALAGPRARFHFIKVNEDICSTFHMSLPEEYWAGIKEEEEALKLLCLGAYVLMLGKCCRGWGVGEERGRGGGGGGALQNDSRGFPIQPQPQRPTLHSDPLQKYNTNPRQPLLAPSSFSSSPSSPLKRSRQAAMGGRLDLGSFLVGVEVSLRDYAPRETQGLFGPLTNDVGIRVNLSSCETFADLVTALGRSLQLAQQHGHFPFSTVADEVGLGHGLPVRFSFLHHRDVRQLTNPDAFYFPETAVGVKGHGLARFGSNCYLTPLNTRMSDSCYLELVLWEGWDGKSVGGGLRHHVNVIRSELVEAFGSEMLRLLAKVAEDPCRPLRELAAGINPPFLSPSRSRSRKLV